MNSSSKQSVSSLRDRVMKASAWVLGGHIASQILRLGSNLIMTRLLVPEMFGVMAIANILLLGLTLFSDVGLKQNIIQSKRGNDIVFLNTAWTIQIIRGIFIWLLALGISSLVFFLNELNFWRVDSAYTDPVLPFVIALLSFSALIRGFDSTKVATVGRNLSLMSITKIEILSQFSGLAVMIIWALNDATIWALVLGALFSHIIYVVLSHTFLPGEKNKLHWDVNVFWDIFHFGKWIFISSIFAFLATNGDRLMLGNLIDSETLGIYSIAFFMINALEQLMKKVFNRVAFPAFSEIAREEPEVLKKTYYKSRRLIDIVTLTIIGFLFVAGHLIIDLLYDERYTDAGYMLEILSISLFEVRYGIASGCFLALGKPKIQAVLIGIRIIALYTLLPLAFLWFGLEGALWVAGGSALFSIPMIFYYKIKYDFFDFKNELLFLPMLVVGYIFGWVLVWFIDDVFLL